jgi:hypothetical protein
MRPPLYLLLVLRQATQAPLPGWPLFFNADPLSFAGVALSFQPS